MFPPHHLLRDKRIEFPSGWQVTRGHGLLTTIRVINNTQYTQQPIASNKATLRTLSICFQALILPCWIGGEEVEDAPDLDEVVDGDRPYDEADDLKCAFHVGVPRYCARAACACRRNIAI